MLEISPALMTFLMFAVLVIGLFMGHPLAFILGGLAVIFGLIGWGPAVFFMFVNRIVGIMDNFLLVAITLFIFMANLLQNSGVADGLFESLRYVLGPIRGGVAMAVIAVCTVFAACTGVIGASVATMGLLALPMMIKYGYDKSLSCGTICAGGTLGILIPPSIMLIVMGDQTGLSIGKLLLGGFIPGFILSALYIGYIAIVCGRRPELGPPLSPEERAAVPVRKRIAMASINLVPPALLIIGVLGAIFSGVTTATEASGVGAFLALLMTIAYRRFGWKMLIGTVITTGRTVSMVMLILVGASCFTGVFLGIGGGQVLTDFIITLGMGNKWLILGIMMAIVFILGALIDWIGIIFITFPVFLPIAEKLGFDQLWFVLLLAVNLQNSFLTPPFGYALFYLKGVAPPEVTTEHIYRGIVPFVILQVVGLFICILFPSWLLYLPNLIK
ncbi:MAG: TRAP transporter large permease subunit [Deltaproteobacteria bacterium]|nr:TRAP transporter large permease subunit [Deltaproteobacteria bacterium]